MFPRLEKRAIVTGGWRHLKEHVYIDSAKPQEVPAHGAEEAGEKMRVLLAIPSGDSLVVAKARLEDHAVIILGHTSGCAFKRAGFSSHMRFILVSPSGQLLLIYTRGRERTVLAALGILPQAWQRLVFLPAPAAQCKRWLENLGFNEKNI